MPKPTAGDVHIDHALTNVSVAFLQSNTNFVAASVFPNIPVQSKSDLYFTYDRGEFNRNEMKERAPGTQSAGGSYKITTDSYLARVYAFHKDVDDQIRSNADSPINLDIEATQYVTLKALILRENLFVTNFFSSTSGWTTTITGVASSPSTNQVLQWNDDASTPVEDIRAGKSVILGSTGFEANMLILGYQTWTQLEDNPEIIDRIKYQGTAANPATVSEQTVAQLLGLDRVVVMKAIQNTAKEGQTSTNSFIGGKSALLLYSAPNAGIMTPSAGYTFSWNGYLGAGPMGNRIKRFRMEENAADRVEIEMAFAMKMVSPDLGYFFTTIVA